MKGKLKKAGFPLASLAIVLTTIYLIACEYSHIKNAEIAAQQSIFRKYQVSPAFLKLNPDFASEQWGTTEDFGCAWRRQSCIEVQQTVNIMQAGKVSQITCEWLVTLKPYANGEYPWDTQEVTDVEPTNTEARELFEPLNTFPHDLPQPVPTQP